MSVSIQPFCAEEHYEEVAKWWKAQNWPVIPLSHLSLTGFVVFHNEVPAAAAWVYQTDSAFCLLEWIVANPLVRREARSEALNALIDHAKVAADVLGFKTIFMSARSESLVARLQKHGFSADDKNMTNLTFHLQGVG